MNNKQKERESLLNEFREIIAEQGWQCREMTDKLVDAAFAALRAESEPVATGIVPDGWKLVPREPDDYMQAGGAGAISFDTTPLNRIWTANKVYREMVKAAPNPPGVPDGQVWFSQHQMDYLLERLGVLIRVWNQTVVTKDEFFDGLKETFQIFVAPHTAPQTEPDKNA